MGYFMLNYEDSTMFTKVRRPVRPDLSGSNNVLALMPKILVHWSDRIIIEEVLKDRTGSINAPSLIFYVRNEYIEHTHELRMEIAKYDMVKELLK